MDLNLGRICGFLWIGKKSLSFSKALENGLIKAILINTPHILSGKVFSAAELEEIVASRQAWD